ncbi:hypothetical protein [Synechococcus sp. CCY 9618]|uniref:hypothetical protein n=1 Tax=Synechococcus sp. CCY 9618 TaxID=2815602 RepID=UPI001C22EF22|nr:hypothetical protein [Synechococcus sp. CCY 9618]
MTAPQIPDTPDELLALQREAARIPEEPIRKPEKSSAKVREVITLLQHLETSPGEDRQLALLLVQRLEAYHDGVVEQMVDDDGAERGQIAAWAIDADRLMQARRLLASVTLG